MYFVGRTYNFFNVKAGGKLTKHEALKG